MCCTYEEYHRCQTCSKPWNRQSHHIGCINQRCRQTFTSCASPPLVNQDMCLPCKIQARERWQKTTVRERSPTRAPAPRPMLKLTKKLTPLFWDGDRSGFSGIWTDEDPSLRKGMGRVWTPGAIGEEVGLGVKC